MKRSWRASLCALLGTFALACSTAGEARAGLMTNSDVNTSKGRSGYKVWLGGTSYSNLYVGPFSTHVWGDYGSSVIDITGMSFCVDITQVLDKGDIAPHAAGPEDGVVVAAVGGGSYDRNIGAAAWLFNRYVNDSAYNTDRSAMAGLQLAIWEVIYDYEDITLSAYNASTATKFLKNASSSSSDGLFRVDYSKGSDKDDVFDLAEMFLVSAFNGNTTGTGNIYKQAEGFYLNLPPPTPPYDKSQDLIMAPFGGLHPTAVAPEPSTLAMAGTACLFGLAYRRVRSSRSRGDR